MSTLRSSRLRADQRLVGTATALRGSKLPHGPERQETGDFIGKLEVRAGTPPGSHLSIAAVPAWLTDPEGHHKTCEADAATYPSHPAALVRSMSDRRGHAESDVAGQADKEAPHGCGVRQSPCAHSAVLRDQLRELLKNQKRDVEVVLATVVAARGGVSARMRRGAEDSGRLVAMCSDSMSEGVGVSGGLRHRAPRHAECGCESPNSGGGNHMDACRTER